MNPDERRDSRGNDDSYVTISLTSDRERNKLDLELYRRPSGSRSSTHGPQSGVEMTARLLKADRKRPRNQYLENSPPESGPRGRPSVSRSFSPTHLSPTDTIFSQSRAMGFSSSCSSMFLYMPRTCLRTPPRPANAATINKSERARQQRRSNRGSSTAKLWPACCSAVPPEVTATPSV